MALMLFCVCHAEDITIHFSGTTAKVKNSAKDSVKVKVKGANVKIESQYKSHKLTLLLTGKSNDGQLMLKTAGKAKVKLENLTLTSREGAPLWLKNKKKVEVVATKGTKNTLTITACKDTANHKAATIWAKDKLLLSGKGTLNVIATGDGCRGIKSKKDITIEELTLNVTTSGNHLGEKPFGFTGKHKYVASTKGITSKGKVTIKSGVVTVRTSTPGAEGIEGRKGVVFNGGKVDVLAADDAVNANATIEFNGAHVTVRSKGNDAVDANPEGGFFLPFGGGNNNKKIEPAIIIRGGTVYAWSQVGSPEEGLDCDMAPIAIEGGTVFSVGGSIGDAPSVPTNATAKQPTVLLVDLNVVKNEPITISDANGKCISTITIPFSMRRSASLVTCPAFKLGNTYTVKTKGYEKTFTLNEPFTTVRP